MDSTQRTALVMVAVGILAMVGGLGWAVAFIGVPYPDPTP
jgi:hypothetical protein